MRLEQQVTALAELDGSQLRQQWQEMTGQAAPSVSPKLLRLALTMAAGRSDVASSMPCSPTRSISPHPAIIDLPIWDAVQQQLKDQRTGERHIRSAAHRSLLAGKLVDGDGQPLVASHASKGAQRYRYYVSRDLQLGDKNANGMRIPAGEIEQLVCARLAERARRSGRADGADQPGPSASRQHH
jgi:hypothetical protein